MQAKDSILYHSWQHKVRSLKTSSTRLYSRGYPKPLWSLPLANLLYECGGSNLSLRDVVPLSLELPKSVVDSLVARLLAKGSLPLSNQLQRLVYGLLVPPIL